MIVRDEEDFLAECLRSVEGIVDEIVLVDTGSTDCTLDIARQFGARYYSVAWTPDFSKMRNLSLHFATKDYILVLDADEVLTLKGCASIRRSLEEFPNADAFFVHILNQTDGEGMIEVEESLNVRLFRNNPQYRYQGALHEQIAESILHANPPGVIFDSDIELLHRGYLKNVVLKKHKKKRNLDIALREIKLHPEDGFRMFNLGVEYVRDRQLDQALSVFHAVHEKVNPSALWVSRFYKVYISTLMQAGKWEEADQVLEEAVKLFPDYTDLVYLKGVYYSQRGEWILALQHYATCIEMGDPPIPPYTIEKGISSYRAYFAMGYSFGAIGKIAEAAVAYRQAFEQNPSFTQAFLRFSNFLLREDTSNATLDYLRSIAALSGGNQFALLGISLALSDQFEQAKEYLERAERTSDVVEHLILTYVCLDERESLRELLEQYDPEGELQARVQRYLFERGRKMIHLGIEKFPESSLLSKLKEEYEKGFR
nr:TPR domain-containing glycosyltransferase [Sulfoacidibacillus thermotolerans]